MHYALDLRTFIFSHYFYTGLRIATGVFGMTLIVLALSDITIAMSFCIGALSTSYMDLPSTLRHKFNEMFASVMLCSIVTLAVSLSAPISWLLHVILVLVVFIASMTTVYGKKTLPLQFSAMFAMTLSLHTHLSTVEALEHSGYFLAGGLIYVCYSMTVSWLLQQRLKQQVLAEALFELARYLDIKAHFYDIHYDINDQFNRLVRQQIILTDKQQVARDLVLRAPKVGNNATLIQVHFAMLDLYEQVLSTHTDYELLRRHLADADILLYLRDLIAKAARDLGTIAYAVNRRRPSFQTVTYKGELQQIEQEMALLKQQADEGKHSAEALDVLRITYNKARGLIDMIGRLHAATQGVQYTEQALLSADMTPFLTQQKYQLRLMIANLNWASPTFRFALRVAAAISVGLFAANAVPNSGHGYWIVLTIAIIMKPTFSQTKNRRTDRLMGSIIGCLLTAGVLHYIHDPIALLALLFISTICAPAFLYVKYRYTAIAASVQILLQINLVYPGSGHVVTERILDTAIGVVIATAFSFLLPNWEFRSLQRVAVNVLRANHRYLEGALALLTGQTPDDFLYRVGRKNYLDSIAAQVAMLVRMLDEPSSKHRAVDDLNHFIVSNYLIVAHIAALRLLVRRHADGLPRDIVARALSEAIVSLQEKLLAAQCAIEGKALPPVTPALPEPETADLATALNWSGWPVLQRRLKMMAADGDRIRQRGLAISYVLVNEPPPTYRERIFG